MNMDELIKYYEQRITLLQSDDDNETSHILQDHIYQQFIEDIANNKFKNIEDVKIISIKLMNGVVEHDHGRWYA